MLLLTHIRKLYCVAQNKEAYKGGLSMANAELKEDAYLWVEDDYIRSVGSMKELPPDIPADIRRIDCSDRLVFPGFVDSHTHIVYPRSRDAEFVMRIQGMTYEEIAAKGGGILNSAKSTASISEEQLLVETIRRALEMLHLGTTTLEVKSGYGLSFESEMKLLRVANLLKTFTPQRIKTTFLGAHAIPFEYKHKREDYIKLVCEEMIPAVAEQKLADYVDVFCDTGYFTVEETEKIILKGAEYGMPAKIHANELGFSGGVQVGVKCKALSVDHLERSGDAEIEALRDSETVPCLLPTVAFFLGIDYPPARQMLEADLPIALATDYNPGSSPCGSMPFVMSLACLRLKMLPEEALCASTLNAAFALRISDQTGSLETHKKADIVISKPMQDLAQIPYYFTQNPVSMVICGGNLYEVV